MSDTAAPIWVILNPTARDADRARDAVERGCQERGLPPPRVLTTTVGEPGWPQAREALASGARSVVVGGGDGTVREVAQALAGSDVELGILPLGTANLFAHNLGLRTRRLEVAVRRALSPGTTAVDVGWASWRPVVSDAVGPPTRDRAFLVMAGIGHDAATVHATDPEHKRRLGWLAYVAAGAERLRAHPLAMRLSIDGMPARRVRTWTLLVVNCGELPSGIRVVGAASPCDGVLDTLEVPLTSPLQWASVAAKGILRHRRDVPALRYGHARTVWAIPDEPAPLHLDGDVVGLAADLRVRVQPGALLVRR